MRWAGVGIGGLVCVYAALVARFFIARPSPSVDYLAAMNAPILAVPEQDRAWPLYRRVIVGTGLRTRAADRPQTPWWVTDTIDWPATEAWINAHAADVELLLQAAAKPRLGFILGPNGSAYDEGMLLPRPPDPADPFRGALINVLLPHLNHARAMAKILASDAYFARRSGDADRLRRDLAAMLGISRHFLDETSGIVVSGLVGVSVRNLALDEIERTLRATPQLLSDADLVGFSHALAGPRTAADLLSLDGERALVLDTVQHIYTDDGHGDGRLTPPGLKFAGGFSDNGPNAPPRQPTLGERLALPAVSAVQGSRRVAVERFEQTYAQNRQALSRPQRERPPLEKVPENRWPDWLPGDLFRDDLSGLTSGHFNAQMHAEAHLARRDGVQIGVALELFRRRHAGAWPAALAELTPTLLPAVPVDPVTGGPLRFKIEGGRPLVYSVGGDRDDDNGRLPLNPKGEPDARIAAEWPLASAPDGDWPLFPALAEHEVERP